MHIMEGYLPFKHAALWTSLSGVIVHRVLHVMRRQLEVDRQTLLKLGAAVGFCFVLSSLKLPSLMGSSSHPTGVALGTFLLGAQLMPIVGLLTLLFQALLLAHGGLTTLGANAFALAILGPWVIQGLYRIMKRSPISFKVNVFLASTLGGMAVYACTALQLALAFHNSQEGFLTAWLRFLVIFAPTQVPLAAAEGLLTVICLKALGKSHKEVLHASGN